MAAYVRLRWIRLRRGTECAPCPTLAVNVRADTDMRSGHTIIHPSATLFRRVTSLRCHAAAVDPDVEL